MAMVLCCSITILPPHFTSFHAIVDGVFVITFPIVTTQHNDANNLCNMQKKCFSFMCVVVVVVVIVFPTTSTLSKKDKERRRK
jgi:hypothetical protein